LILLEISDKEQKRDETPKNAILQRPDRPRQEDVTLCFSGGSANAGLI